ncbi:CRTAC1 family protein [Rugosimonospora acidiphila]|uniref:CRTAC1 family protein n=1 Tax=Rugosimonospora acidiphila TaxID=556531 RepID=A0ABP9RKT8_9ACTN
MDVRLRARHATVALLAVALCVAAGVATRIPGASAAEVNTLASRFSFSISDLNSPPPGARTERVVEPELRHLQSWISAVGASAGLADFDGDGLPNDACLVDPRDDSVTIRPVPARADGYPPIRLAYSGVAFDAKTTAPMGCVPADLNEDGYTDVLVYFWGRTPVALLRRPGTALSASAFLAVNVAADPTQIWNSTTANVVDLDGDGHLDLFIGNYFPDGAQVLNADANHDPLMQMQDSMSDAANGGRNAILRLDHIDVVDGVRVPHYTDQSDALTTNQSRAWTLATGAQDLNNDGLPELYVANDFGPDYLLLNRSIPGDIRFGTLTGSRDATEPKSKVIGGDSFKSMGVTYTDLNSDGRPDILVSNITTEHGLQESNFAFVSTSTGPLVGGKAPYRDDSESLGLSRSGWGWDIKAADFDGDGTDELVQAVGFVKGTTNRWAELQELAMSNDLPVREPWAWPDFPPGTDIAGHQRDPFFVRGPDGRFVDIAKQLGIDNPGVSRGIAIGDVDHDGRPDVLMANQWANSQFLHNTGPARGYLGLRLLLPPVSGAPGALPRPAIGASVTVTKADGTVSRAQLYPANGHTGVNAPELLFGLGAPSSAPVSVTVTWRDTTGPHSIGTTLSEGWHDLMLTPGTAG